MPNLFIRQPFGLGASKGAASGVGAARNGVALTNDPDRHLRDKIIAVLFTAPGERVNHPRFGAGLNRAVFQELNELTVTAIEYRVLEGLRRDLGDEIRVDAVDISTNAPAGELLLTLTYQRRDDRLTRTLGIQI